METISPAVPSATATPRQALPYDSLGVDVPSMKEAILKHLEYTLAELPKHVDSEWEPYVALALAVRDRMIERWIQTQDTYYDQDAKRVYYMSLEFLMGRTLGNSLVNLGLRRVRRQALADSATARGAPRGRVGRRPRQRRPRAAGGVLPRFAGDARLPGLRLRHPLRLRHLPPAHRQRRPDRDARRLAPLRQPVGDRAPGDHFRVHFYGRVAHVRQRPGPAHNEWVDTHDVLATPYDTPIPGYGNETVNTLRLWGARAVHEFDLGEFNDGRLRRRRRGPGAVREHLRVLYPNDNSSSGKELRLAQEYFFVSATLQDIIRRYKKRYEMFDRQQGLKTFDRFAEKAAIQLNDTHPALAIPELMRILVDLEELGWDEAWDITTRTFGYTNHTVMPEALERWPMSLFGACCRATCRSSTRSTRASSSTSARSSGADDARCRRMSIIEEGGEKRVRMATPRHRRQPQRQRRRRAAHRHPEDRLFRDFYELWPEKFNNKTNGVTQRRWLLKSNPGLSGIITERDRRRAG